MLQPPGLQDCVRGGGQRGRPGSRTRIRIDSVQRNSPFLWVDSSVFCPAGLVNFVLYWLVDTSVPQFGGTHTLYYYAALHEAKGTLMYLRVPDGI